ncbi:MAG: cytochrome C biogenesis protein [Fidelibacterota bacterium]|nr:MAG: cytochrome C biogenesis protein [Candidatus Neomarinimicrobiota bacterium]
MIVNLFSTLSEALQGSLGLSLAAAFAWGTISILLSPCHLSSIPLIIGFLNTQQNVGLGKSFGLSLLFAVGILATITAIGLLTAAGGRLLGDIGTIGNYAVAAIFIVVGLYLIGMFRISWPAIGITSMNLQGAVGALALGFLLGIGLGPCTFAFIAPLLAVVFKLATVNLVKAACLVAAFGVGHCAVLVGAGTFTTRVQQYLNWTESSRMTTYLRRFCGTLVILAGVYMIFGLPA